MDGVERGWHREPSDRPLVIGHRGASACATENTVEAFARAATDGADGVELDVLCCASGEVVVFHDDDLQRLAGRSQKVSQLAWSELRAVPLPGGTRVPTLEAAFEACGPHLLVNVELKSGGALDDSVPHLIDGVSAIIDRLNVSNRVIVSSFDPRVVWLWHQRRPDVKTAFLFERGDVAAVTKAMALPLVQPYAVHPEAALCTAETVQAWHAAGYFVTTWTVDDADALQALARVGVDGFITNDPAAALRVLAT